MKVLIKNPEVLASLCIGIFHLFLVQVKFKVLVSLYLNAFFSHLDRCTIYEWGDMMIYINVYH